MNSVLLAKMASAGSIFLFWHFLTLAIGITGLLLEKSVRKGNSHLRSALLRLTLLLVLGVPAICAILNSLPSVSQPVPAAPKQRPGVVISPTTARFPSLDWEHLAVWRPLIVDGVGLPGHFATATPDELPSMQVLYLGFLAASSLVSCFLLLRLLSAFFEGRVLRSRGKPIEVLNDLCQAMAAARGISAPQVLQVEEIRSPMIMGFFKSVILLPKNLQARGEIYSHELTHLQRHDIWWHLLARLATALMPLQPALWHLRKALERADEDVCDDMVLVQGANPSAYMELLLDVAESEHSATPQLCLPMAAFRSQLEHRLHRILDAKRPLAGRLCASSLGLWLMPLLAAGTVAGAIYLDTERALTADEKESPSAPVATRPMNAQSTPVDPAPTVRSITFESIGPHTDQQMSEVLAASGFQVGMPIQYPQMRRAIAQIYALGIVANILCKTTPDKDGVILTLIVKFNPKVIKIYFEGISGDEEARIRPLLHLKVGAMESSYLAFQDAQLITSELFPQNPYVKATAQEDVSEEFGTAKITYKIR